jgi:hypothetical protein
MFIIMIIIKATHRVGAVDTVDDENPAPDEQHADDGHGQGHREPRQPARRVAMLLSQHHLGKTKGTFREHSGNN